MRASLKYSAARGAESMTRCITSGVRSQQTSCATTRRVSLSTSVTM
ncbi:MAG TPA: hypothetical protein VF508_01160 [Pyrinomonadaceae bacterium]